MCINQPKLMSEDKPDLQPVGADPAGRFDVLFVSVSGSANDQPAAWVLDDLRVARGPSAPVAVNQMRCFVGHGDAQ